MRRLLVLLSFLTVPSTVNAATYRDVSGPFSVITRIGVRYVSGAASASAQRADLLDQCTPRSGPWGPPYPGLIIVHGGAWRAGSRNGDTGNLQLCQFWASWGFSAVTVDYRLIDDTDPTTWWPAQVFDVQAAVRWMRANAAALRLNSGQIVASGDSAGGQLAHYLGYQPYTVAIRDNGNARYGEIDDEVTHENTSQSPQVQAIISEFGPSVVGFGPVMASGDAGRPMHFWSTPDGLLPRQSSSDMALYWLGQPSTRSLSADTLFVQGDADPIVPPTQSRYLFDILARYGRSRHYYGYRGGHEFAGPINGGIGDDYFRIRQAEVSFAINHCLWAKVVPQWAPRPRDKTGRPVAFDRP